MAKEQITVKSSNGCTRFKWYDSDGELPLLGTGRLTGTTRIGKVKRFEDALAMAKSHAGGSN